MGKHIYNATLCTFESWSDSFAIVQPGCLLGGGKLRIEHVHLERMENNQLKLALNKTA